eukprot:1482080-Prorocentrum_lima.AAC.1
MPCHWASPPRATATDDASQTDRAAPPPSLLGRGGTSLSLRTNAVTARDIESCRTAIDKPMDKMAMP